MAKSPCSYDSACRRANEIAKWDPFAAAGAVAEAILTCREHGIDATVDSRIAGHVTLTYRNWFGPTCTVDDVFERMTMREWRSVCFAVLTAVFDGSVPWKDPIGCVQVTATSEIDTDIISEVRLRFSVPYKVATAVTDWLDRRRETQYEK